MLTFMVCCHKTSIITGVGSGPFQLGGCRKPKNDNGTTCLRLYLFYLSNRCFIYQGLQRWTQRQLAEVTGLTQSVMSRLENGEEIYASAFVTILDYYYGKINLDFLFAPDFQADSHRLIPPCNEELQSIRRQLDILADIISTTNETCLAQIETLKKNVR